MRRHVLATVGGRHDEDEWALSFYMNGCSYDGSATDIDAEYKEDGLTSY